MRPRVFLVAIGIAILAGCHRGAAGKDLAIAHRPGGASVVVQTQSGVFAGQLVAVQDTGLVLSQRSLFFVSFHAMSSLRAEELGSDYQISGWINDPKKLERLRLVSQFPQGMTPDIQKKLPARMGQATIDILK